MKRTLLIGIISTLFILNGQQEPLIKIEQVMTSEELRNTGVATLSPGQREALNRWLVSYSIRIFTAAQATQKESPASAPPKAVRPICAPTIESTISGEFNGWEGETIFKLDNGQIWQQAEHDYTYSYAYRPDVTIYQTSGGCRMKVEDEEETILVRRIK